MHIVVWNRTLDRLKTTKISHKDVLDVYIETDYYKNHYAIYLDDWL